MTKARRAAPTAPSERVALTAPLPAGVDAAGVEAAGAEAEAPEEAAEACDEAAEAEEPAGTALPDEAAAGAEEAAASAEDSGAADDSVAADDSPPAAEPEPSSPHIWRTESTRAVMAAASPGLVVFMHSMHESAIAMSSALHSSMHLMVSVRQVYAQSMTGLHWSSQPAMPVWRSKRWKGVAEAEAPVAARVSD